MDTVLANNYEKLLSQAKKVLQVENKNWPNYVRSEFAELRVKIKDIEDRKNYIDRVTRDFHKACSDEGQTYSKVGIDR